MKIKSNPLQLFIILYLFFNSSIMSAQSNNRQTVTVSGNIDFVSRYIWRGLEIGQAPSIQPGLSAKWKDFTLGSWGAYKLTGHGEQETDFFLTKKIGFLTLGLSDYWTFRDTTAIDFFDYREKSTAHILEAQALFTGGENIPVNFLATYFFYGADKSRSIYLELQYYYSSDVAEMIFFVGYQPKGSYYGSDMSFINLGCTLKKSIPLTERWSLPISLSLIMNPDRKSVYLVGGLTL
jgi:hypothetical protein